MVVVANGICRFGKEFVKEESPSDCNGAVCRESVWPLRRAQRKIPEKIKGGRGGTCLDVNRQEGGQLCIDFYICRTIEPAWP